MLCITEQKTKETTMKPIYNPTVNNNIGVDLSLDLGRTDHAHQCHYPSMHNGFTHSQKTTWQDGSTFHSNSTPGMSSIQGIYRPK